MPEQLVAVRVLEALREGWVPERWREGRPLNLQMVLCDAVHQGVARLLQNWLRLTIWPQKGTYRLHSLPESERFLRRQRGHVC